MVTIVSTGYSRKNAPELLRLAESGRPVHDVAVGGESLWTSMLDTLRVEALRSDAHTRYAASDARERVMKELFISHSKREPQGKVLLRFGRNHVHRGYDARGISTLGNFVSEWSIARGQSAFNVGVFAAGGKEHLAGHTFNADERQDEPAFSVCSRTRRQQCHYFRSPRIASPSPFNSSREAYRARSESDVLGRQLRFSPLLSNRFSTAGRYRKAKSVTVGRSIAVHL